MSFDVIEEATGFLELSVASFLKEYFHIMKILIKN